MFVKALAAIGSHILFALGKKKQINIGESSSYNHSNVYSFPLLEDYLTIKLEEECSSFVIGDGDTINQSTFRRNGYKGMVSNTAKLPKCSLPPLVHPWL